MHDSRIDELGGVVREGLWDTRDGLDLDRHKARLALDDLKRLADAKDVEVRRLRAALVRVQTGCLLDIRRAAFGPEIGVRYTEQIRADIANQCARLERLIEETLDA